MSTPSRARARPVAPPSGPTSRPASGSGPRRAAPGPRQPVRMRSRPQLTGRGAVLVMLAVFLVGDLIGTGLHATVVTGLGYTAGCLLAVRYARREAMLVVAATPPALFLLALVSAELMTAGGSTLLAAAEGTLLTLAGTAPWLLVVTLACVGAATARGLPRCVQDLRAALAGQDAAGD